MLLKAALEIHKKSKWKIDILETLWIEIKNNYLEEKFYKDKIDKLPKWKYFLSDLDWTFFRGTLIKEAFSLFAKYLRNQNIENVNLEKYKEFLDDYKLFKKIEKDAYNKKIDYIDYLNSGLFIIYKYQELIDWRDFLWGLKNYFYKKQKVNPYRFSIEKMSEVLKKWNHFLFISWASNFVFDIYLELLKVYIWQNIWEKYIKQIHWISSYADFENKNVYNMWNMTWKYEFIAELKKQDFIQEITGWMWDTSSDYGIANNLPEKTNFYFINPAYTAISRFEELANKKINFHFISERKDFIFEYNIKDIEILN